MLFTIKKAIVLVYEAFNTCTHNLGVASRNSVTQLMIGVPGKYFFLFLRENI